MPESIVGLTEIVDVLGAFMGRFAKNSSQYRLKSLARFQFISTQASNDCESAGCGRTNNRSAPHNSHPVVGNRPAHRRDFIALAGNLPCDLRAVGIGTRAEREHDTHAGVGEIGSRLIAGERCAPTTPIPLPGPERPG